MNIVFSLVCGIVTGMGMGGGAILIFLLTNFSGVSQQLAQGANILFFIPTCVISIILNGKKKSIDKKTALTVGAFGIIGAIIGAYISVNIKVKNLRKFFGIFLIIVATFEIYKLIKQHMKKM